MKRIKIIMKQSCKFHELVTSNVNFDVATVHFIVVEGNPEAWICMIKKQTNNTHTVVLQRKVQIAHPQNVLFTAAEK